MIKLLEIIEEKYEKFTQDALPGFPKYFTDNLKIGDKEYDEIYLNNVLMGVFIVQFNGNENKKLEAYNFLMREINIINNFWNNGGILYRIILVRNNKEIRKKDLGENWTYRKDKLPEILKEITFDLQGVENYSDEEMKLYKPYLITINTQPHNIETDSLMYSISNYENEFEIQLKGLNNIQLISIKKLKID